jgi:hypothetical protein
MNPRNVSRFELVDLTTDIGTGVANGKVTGFSAAQNTAFSDALTDANAILAAANLAAVEARSAAQAATMAAQNAQDTVLKLLSELKFAMRGVDSPAVDYEALGLDAPDTVRSVYQPQTHTELAATGFSNHTNRLTFRGNNRAGSVVYAVEAKIGDTAPFVLIGTTTNQGFTHEGVTPGEYYLYRVRAQSGRNIYSQWSNEAVVYGS